MATVVDTIDVKRQANRYVEADQYVQYKKPTKFNRHNFVCVDGEGYDIDGQHQYVYLCAYNGERYQAIRNDQGLGSLQCFKFLTSLAAQNPTGIHVIYGGSYDANMMLRDLNKSNLMQLRERGWTWWRDYRIEFIPWKYFQVTNQTTRTTCRLWDVIGFFQMSFVQALDTWLGVKSEVVNKGKAKRSKFQAADIETIVSYCHEELRYFEQLVQQLWSCLDTANIPIRRWDGAGAIAQQLLIEYGVHRFKGSQAQQEANYFFARCAYAGGRFECLQPGDFKQKIYAIDINSAYPYAISLLPEFRGLKECAEKTHGRCKIGEYDLLYIQYRGNLRYPIHPYFHRDKHLQIAYPAVHTGWHWAPEFHAARSTNTPGKTKILRHLVYYDNGHRPFRWVQDLYDLRQRMKDPEHYDPREKVIKLGINSLYGKMAQQKGWKEGKPIPRFHQLYWAGWVTAKCRSMVYAAMMQAPESIIAVETDSVISTVKLDLPYSSNLGEWEYKEYDGITYVQSGLYFASLGGEEKKLRSRGINAESISREKIIRGWDAYKATPSTSYVLTKTKRYHTLASGLHTGRMDLWRQWKQQKKEIALVPLRTGKRTHSPTFCGDGGCKGWGEGKTHTTLARHVGNEVSTPYAVLWDGEDAEELQDMYLAREMEREEEIVFQ